MATLKSQQSLKSLSQEDLIQLVQLVSEIPDEELFQDDLKELSVANNFAGSPLELVLRMIAGFIGLSPILWGFYLYYCTSDKYKKDLAYQTRPKNSEHKVANE